jgi:hypothetical protein
LYDAPTRSPVAAKAVSYSFNWSATLIVTPDRSTGVVVADADADAVAPDQPAAVPRAVTTTAASTATWRGRRTRARRGSWRDM